MSSDSTVNITLFLAITDEQKRNDLERWFMTDYLDISVHPITSKSEYDQLLRLKVPHLVVTDHQFLQGTSILNDGSSLHELAQTAFIVMGSWKDQDRFLDEMMLGKFQFFEVPPIDEEWRIAVKKAFKFSFDAHSTPYVVKSVKMGDVIMNVGDPANQVYILKKGKLQAFQLNSEGQKVILGEIVPGEFFGEMAYFNSEPRSASIIALEGSELIEIPLSTFDRAIYQKPAWAMKLIETLSKRLKKYIEKK
jgi:hypothetical protein